MDERLTIAEPVAAKLKALTLALVEYRDDDLLGKLFALISLAPLAIIPSFITFTAARREIYLIYFFLGMCGNELLNLILKYMISEPRPVFEGYNLQGTYGKHGMPSNHTQFMFYFAVFGSLSLCLRCTFKHALIWKSLGSIAFMGSALLVAASRIYLKYHTENQVVVGAAAGSAFAVVWFSIAHFLLSGVFRQVVELPVCQWLMIRDSADIPNVLTLEYENHVARLGKKTK